MKTIGIIDDDKDSNCILSAFLEDGKNVEVFEEWEPALKTFEKNPPALILLDISLPGTTGEEVLKRIRENSKLKNVKVIALTGYSQPNARTEFLKKGFDEYLSKPITDIDFFLEIIKKTLKDADVH